MIELTTLARPYAQAVFKTAVENNAVSAWSDMLALLAIVMQDTQMIPVFVNPKVSRQQLTQLLIDICGNQLNANGINLLKLLVKNERLVLAPQIAKLYESFKAQQQGYIDVEVISAYALTKDEQVKLANILTQKLHKKAHISTSIDKRLLGGFLAKAGNKVIDGSIKGQLQQLAKQL